MLKNEMKEAAVVISDLGDPIYWHLPENRSYTYIPDSNKLWQIIWDNRLGVAGIAHSHPGGGVPHPSNTDITTFDAIERGLGRGLQWWITNNDNIVVCHRMTLDDIFSVSTLPSDFKPNWLLKLRILSRLES